MDIEQLLDDEIESEFEQLGSVELGSDTYKVAVDGLSKLVDRKIELKKVEADAEYKAKQREIELKKLEEEALDKTKNREVDLEFRAKQIAEEKKDRLWRNIISVAGIVLPSAITVWGTFKTLKFEETGTVTTLMGRGFVNKLLPKK